MLVSVSMCICVYVSVRVCVQMCDLFLCVCVCVCVRERERERERLIRAGQRWLFEMMERASLPLACSLPDVCIYLLMASDLLVASSAHTY